MLDPPRNPPRLPLDREPTVEEEVACHTAWLCEQHKGLSAERVAGVLGRMAASGWPLTFGMNSGRNTVQVAVSCFGADGATRLLENEDPTELLWRIETYGAIANVTSPVYDLPELAGRIERLIATMCATRDSLLEVGYPAIHVSRWHFPDRAFASHLPVKGYLTVEKTRRADGELTLEYSWPVRAADVLHAEASSDAPRGAWRGFWQTHGGDYLLEEGTQVEAVAYQDAALIAGLSLVDAGRLQRLRPQLLDLKLAVLRILAQALRGVDRAAVWSCSLMLLSEMLLEEDARFLLEMDRWFVGRAFGEEGTTACTAPLMPGGLSELLGVIAHVEQELTVGLHATTHRNLARLLQPRGQSRLEPGHYLRARACGEGKLVDLALNRFRSLSAEAEAHYAEFTQRAGKALESELKVRLTLDVRRQELAFCSAYLSHLRQSLTPRQPPPPLPRVLGPPRAPGKASTNVFRGTETSWIISFEGVRVELSREQGGHEYLVQLLRSPRQTFRTAELAAAMIGAPPRLTSSAHEDLSSADWEALEGLSMRMGDDTEHLGRADSPGASRHTLQETREQLQAARAAGNTALARVIRAQLAELEADGGARRPRQRRGLRRPAAAVKKSIQRAVKELESELPSLGAHLRSAVKSFHSYEYLVYDPSPPATWET